MSVTNSYSIETVLPEVLKAAKVASRVLIFVHYADDLLCTLNDLRDFKALKLVLMNSSMSQNAVRLSTNIDAFDFRIDYKGPALSAITYGNKAWLEAEEKTDVIIPSIHESVTRVMDDLLTVFHDRDNIFLMSTFEEALMQMAVLREHYGLRLGLSAGMAEKFVVKSRMKECWEEHGINQARYAILNARKLRSMSEDEINRFVDATIPPFPCFIKPLAASSSFETRRIPDRETFAQWIKDSKDMVYNDFLIEEYMYYPYYQVTVLCTPEGFMVANMLDSLEDYSYAMLRERGTNAMERMMSRNEEMYAIVERVAIDVIKSSGLSNEYGTYFVELLHKSDGSLAPTEMAARPPAGLSGTNSYEIFTGIDVESYAMVAPWGCMPKVHQPKYKFIRILGFCAKKSGTLVKYNDVDSSLIQPGAYIAFVDTYWQPGDHIYKVPKTMDSLLMNVVVAGDDEDAVAKTARSFLDTFDAVVVEPSEPGSVQEA